MVVESGSGKAGERAVHFRKVTEIIPDLVLTHLRRQVVVSFQPQGVRDIGIEIVECLHATSPEHFLNVVGSVGKISMGHGLSMFFGGAESFVSLFVHEIFEFGGIGHLNLYDPVLHGILVDKTWVVDEGFVDVDYRTAYG